MPDGSLFSIADTDVSPGRRVGVELALPAFHACHQSTLRVHVVNGRHAGPTLFVSAAVHGDELNGIEIIRRLLRSPLLEALRGTLLAVPVVNPYGFLQRSRYLPDRRDLNRCFPGDRDGPFAARMAEVFMRNVVARADFGIDLHTGGLDRENQPQARVRFDQPDAIRAARAFGAPLTLESFVHPGSLRAEAPVPVLVYEGGEALRLDEAVVRIGLRGILGVMRRMGMLPESAQRVNTPRSVMVRSTSWLRSPGSGLFHPLAAGGDAVERGQLVGFIADPLDGGELAIRAPEGGIIVGCGRLPLVHEGDALFQLAQCRDPAATAQQLRHSAYHVASRPEFDETCA